MSCCFEPDTKILMYDGSFKNIQDFKKGDLVLGLDGKSKKVLDLYHDYDDMFEITSRSSSNNKKDIKYVVNKRHNLFLKNKKNEIIRIKVEDYLKMGYRWRRKYYLVKNNYELEFSFRATEDPYDMGAEIIQNDNSNNIPEYFKINSRSVRSELLSGMLSYGGEIRDERVHIYHPSFELCRDIQWIARSLGFTAKIRKMSDNTREQIDSDEYQVVIFGSNISEITLIFSKEETHMKLFKHSNLFRIKLKYKGEGEYYGIKVEDGVFYTNEFDIVGS